MRPGGSVTLEQVVAVVLAGAAVAEQRMAQRERAEGAATYAVDEPLSTLRPPARRVSIWGESRE